MESSLAVRGLHVQLPPAYETREDVNPSLLMSWWATAFSIVIIIVRLCGRYVRMERFFPEDKVMTLSMVPLVCRMVLVHYVLVYGTNNVQTAGLTAEEVSKREIGSKLVLVARIFYAIFIWTAKLTVCEFLKRVTGMVSRRSTAIFLRFVHFFLASTLVAVVIATLAECQPFDQYWQVIPNPGPPCRCGYAQLITMGTCDVITDLLLIAFPVPIVIMSRMPIKRKIGLVILFCLSLLLVGITCYRVPTVIERRGNQPYRSLMASLEILAATAVSNALVIGSFVRDRGVKKLKYKREMASASVSESLDNSYIRRNTLMQHQWGSDSDLAGGLGIRLDPKLHPSASSSESHTMPMPVPPVPLHVARTGSLNPSWSFHQPRPSDDNPLSMTDSLDMDVSPREYIKTNQSPRENPALSQSTLSSPRVSFFDVGGLLDQDKESQHSRAGLRPTRTEQGLSVNQSRPSRGGRAFLEDLGVLPSRTAGRTTPRFLTPLAPTNTRPLHALPPYRAAPDVSLDVNVELQDVGGLLSRHSPPTR
ncbi:uncharacterized protein N7484_002420 [Penicillium longicatenatum]|uniref:uncharacterized protein n=1 Tax=Penicillium longicatenatum TaxID=1561947 RepID=UPI002547A10C|nr:uncharacterized protein N7484_002420 [Penicillium longicatenatum]KAJ5658771.1 hypothetical protein N7484_002420 [Penicillium longicatenatum]